VAQGIVLLVGSMILDGGFFLFTSLVAAAGYWVALIMIVARHPASPGRADLIWARAGFVIALALGFAIGPLVLYSRGQL
jgi:hypothetical protein